jgi:hypothetical protein
VSSHISSYYYQQIFTVELSIANANTGRRRSARPHPTPSSSANTGQATNAPSNEQDTSVQGTTGARGSASRGGRGARGRARGRGRGRGSKVCKPLSKFTLSLLTYQ